MAGPYYVRKTGLDSNDGLSAGAAFLTIDKAANTVVSNTDVWIGSGSYEELVTMDTSGTSGNQIRYMADIDGAKTGDGGLVIISAHDSELAAGARAYCVDMDSKEFITWDGVIFNGGTTACVGDALDAGNKAYEGVVFNDCAFISNDHDMTVYLDFNDGATPTADGPQFTNCVFTGGAVRLFWSLNSSANRDRKMAFENCLFLGGVSDSISSSGGIYWNFSGGSGSFGSIGVSITNCTFVGKYSALYCSSESITSTFTVENNYLYGCRFGWWDADGTNQDAIDSNYNTFVAVHVPITSVTAGANDRGEGGGGSGDTGPGLFGGVADLMLYSKLGWSWFKPWEPIRLTDGVDDYDNPVIGDGNTSTATATDHYSNPRPMWGTVDDRGAVEGRAYPVMDTTSKISTGTANSGRFDGAGYHDFFVPVAAQSTTITVDCEYDSNYAGTLPSMTVTNDAIMTEVTDTMVAAANTEETLTSGGFTPSAAGVVRVRIRSSDTSATGKCWFDVLTVT